MADELQELGNDQAFLKCSIFGVQGSGKTRMATEIAIGLSKYLKSKKPVFFLDTETGSAHVKRFFDESGIKLVGKKTRGFSELIRQVGVAERNCDIMIIDSVTHFWLELCEAYRMKRYACKRCSGTRTIDGKDCPNCNGSGAITDRLAMYDYYPVKNEWARFVMEMTNSKLHMLICGRSGNEYESQENLEGKKEIIKAGTKIKAESEFGYETALRLETKRERVEAGYEYFATVLTDKYDVINGKEFKFPKFADVLPHIALLNLGGEHVGAVQGSSVEDLKTPRGSSEEYSRQKQIVLEEIQAAISGRFPTSSVDDRRGRAEIQKFLFKTQSQTAIEALSLETLREAWKKLPDLIKPVVAESTK